MEQLESLVDSAVQREQPKSHSSNTSQPSNSLTSPENSVSLSETNNTSNSRNSISSVTRELPPQEAEVSTMENRKQPQQQQQQPQKQKQQQVEEQQRSERSEEKDDSSLLMFSSCGQLLLGVVLVVFGVLALVHGASLGGSGAGLWAGAGALVAGALGVVATLASPSGFSTAHLATSLVALALSNMAAITALTAVVRDSQRTTPELTLLQVPGESAEMEGGWSGLLASIGLLVASVAELLVSGYSCLTLTPKLCGCLRPNTVGQGAEQSGNGRLKTRNLVQQWVIAQNRLPKTQPVYLVQPVMQVHPIVQPAYGPAKFPPGSYMPPVPLPPGYGPLPAMLPSGHPYTIRPPSQMVIRKQKRHVTSEPIGSLDRRKQQPEARPEPVRRKTLSEPEVDLARTYTGLDKKISEEFISIAMDPDRKSKASSNHGSEIGLSKNS